MSSLSQFRTRGRAYQCKRCGKVDRKGRMISHILKHHVPFDRVPFSCSLCSFRCTDKQSLLDHLNKYSRHRDEEAKTGTPDYTKVLRMAVNPYVFSVNDMVQLSREESIRWYGRHTQPENPLDDSEGLFEDEEDDVVVSGGRPLPKWLMSGPSVTPSQMPLNTVQPSITQPLLFSSRLPKPVPVMSTLSTLASTSTLSSIPVVSVEEPTAARFNAPSLGLSTLNTDDMVGFASLLNTPPMMNNSPSQTPLQDERILPQLHIKDCDLSYPLDKETTGTDDRQSKRQKLDNQQQTQKPSEESPVIIEAAKLIVNAINENTRVQRDNSKAFDRMTVEISRVERKLHLIQQCLSQSEFINTQQANKENKKPTLKTKTSTAINK